MRRARPVRYDGAAMVNLLPRNPESYRPLTPLVEEALVHVPGAEVAWADHAALRRDFPFLARWSDAAVRDWIVASFSFLPPRQAQLAGLRHGPVPMDASRRAVSWRQFSGDAYHLEPQGRGDIMVARGPGGAPAGLVDRKGVGVSANKLRENEWYRDLVHGGLVPPAEYQTKSLSNGLMLLGEALVEALRMQVVQRVYESLGGGLQAVEGYFVLRLPFDVLRGAQPPMPAAIYGRQANVGRVWAGKVFHPYVNSKQTDFFMSHVDGGSVRVRHPALERRMSYLNAQFAEGTYRMGAELASAYERGGREAIEALARGLTEGLPAGGAPTAPAFSGAAQAALHVLDRMGAEPRRFFRYAELLVWAQNRSFRELTEAARPVIGAILDFPDSWEDVDGEGRPARLWGIRLIPSLGEQDRARAARAVRDGGRAQRRALAETAWALPERELAPLRPFLLDDAADVLARECAKKLLQPGAEDDPRAGTCRALLDAALARLSPAQRLGLCRSCSAQVLERLGVDPREHPLTWRERLHWRFLRRGRKWRRLRLLEAPE